MGTRYGLPALFGVIIVALFTLLIWRPAFGPIDDHLFLDTLCQGKILPLFIQPDIARFYPLNGQEYNVIAWLTGPIPFYFYIWNAVELLLLIAIIKRLFAALQLSRKSFMACTLLLLLSPGFAHSWFRLLVPERNIVLLLSLMLLCFYSLKQSQSTFAKTVNFVGAMVSGTVALYFKEPVFILVGAFAFLVLLRDFFNDSLTKVQKNLAFVLLGSSALYLCIHVSAVGIHPQSSFVTAKHGSLGPVLSRVKTLGSYLFSDPLVMVAMPLGLLFRLAEILRLKNKGIKHIAIACHWSDIFLLVSLGYLLCYIALGIFTPYYLFPCYVFLLPAIADIVARSALTLPKRLAGAVVAFLVVTSSFPLGLSLISYNKWVPVNHNETLAFLKSHLLKTTHREDASPTPLFLFRIDRETNSEVLDSMAQYLTWSGVPAKDVQVLPLETDPAGLPQGSLLLITPNATSPFTNAVQTAMGPAWSRLYATETPLKIPNVSLQVLAKLLVKQLLPGRNGLAGTENYLRLPDYVMYIKR